MHFHLHSEKKAKKIHFCKFLLDCILKFVTSLMCSDLYYVGERKSREARKLEDERKSERSEKEREE